MATPQIIPQIPQILAEIMFWGGLVGIVVTGIYSLWEKYVKKSKVSNKNNTKDYLRDIGMLYELLDECDYTRGTSPKGRKDTSDFLFKADTPYTLAYRNIDKLKSKMIYNEKLHSLLKEFLSNFSYDILKNPVSPEGVIYTIKPTFETKKEFDKNKKNIKLIIDKIVNQLN